MLLDDIKCSSCGNTNINYFYSIGIQNLNDRPYLYLVNCKKCNSTISTTEINYRYLIEREKN